MEDLDEFFFSWEVIKLLRIGQEVAKAQDAKKRIEKTVLNNFGSK